MFDTIRKNIRKFTKFFKVLIGMCRTMRYIWSIEFELQKHDDEIADEIRVIVNSAAVATFTGYSGIPCAAAAEYTSKRTNIRRKVIVFNEEAHQTENKALFNALFLHEYAHLTLGHLSTPDRQGTLGIELEADRYVFENDREAAKELEKLLQTVGTASKNEMVLLRAYELRELFEEEEMAN